MRISVSTNLRPTIGGKLIDAAPSVAQLHAMLGPPTRIVGPVKPAPVGHRNNQIHVYGRDGICFYEHHYTRRLSGCLILMVPEEHTEFSLNQCARFSGTLDIAGHELSASTDLQSFFRDCPVTFEPTMLGWLRAMEDEFSVILDLKGRRLPSGRRSKLLRLASISLDWPHDPWGEPAGDK